MNIIGKIIKSIYSKEKSFSELDAMHKESAKQKVILLL
jgi:histone deacetylase complex regulatory component SIN3